MNFSNTEFDNFKNLYIHRAIIFENVPLLKMLFQVYIKSCKNNPELLKFLNYPTTYEHYLSEIPNYKHKEVTPLYLAAEKGDIKVVELFVKHKDYIENIDFKYNGCTALDIAALNGHNEIVKMLMPLITDAQEKKQKQDKIQNFVETTCTSDESVAKTYLSRHNWDIIAAVQTFFNEKCANMTNYTKQYSNDDADTVS